MMTAVAYQLIIFIVFTNLIFYACLELRFPDVKTNPATGVLYLGSAEYSAVMWGAFPGTWANWQWLPLSTIYCCALRPWFRTVVIYHSCWFLDMVVLSFCAEMGCLWLVGWLHMCEMDMGCACLLPVYGRLEWPSSGMVGFYYHERSWCCDPRLWNCIRLWSTGEWPYSFNSCG